MPVEPQANIEQLAKELDMPVEHLGELFEVIEKNGYQVKGVFNVDETLKNLRAENAELRREVERLKRIIVAQSTKGA